VERPFVVPNVSSPPLPDEMFNSVLLIGADASGFLADVLIYVLLPSDGSTPIMVSLPRDLYLVDECSGGYARINSALGGCRGVASGPELLSLTVKDFTGVEVDHFARVNFSGFEWVVDQLGGATVCVGDRPIRDPKSGLDLGPGCHEADGATTLAWVRSRNPEYQGEDGAWTRPGGSDFDRQAKQQEILFQLARKLTSASSVGSLSSILSNLSSVVRTDSGWGAGEMASLAFQYRSLDPSSVRRLSISIQNYRTPGGAQVLIPARRFNDTLAAVYPAAARSAGQ
jgi:LCP family protein required for cell wall assembly